MTRPCAIPTIRLIIIPNRFANTATRAAEFHRLPRVSLLLPLLFRLLPLATSLLSLSLLSTYVLHVHRISSPPLFDFLFYLFLCFHCSSETLCLFIFRRVNRRAFGLPMLFKSVTMTFILYDASDSRIIYRPIALPVV